MRTENVEWFFVQTFLTTLSVTASRKRCQAGGNCRVQLAVNGGAASGCFFGHRWGSLWLRAAVGATPCWRAPAAERQGVLWRSNVIKLSCTISPLRSIESIPSSLISIDLNWSSTIVYEFCLSKLSLQILQVVEIGCGTGCAGLAAAALGAEAVLRPNTMSVVVVSDLCHSKYCTNLYEPYGWALDVLRWCVSVFGILIATLHDISIISRFFTTK